MGKKRRSTAKTGDAALYKSRDSSNNIVKKKNDNDDDDDMYNEVDRFHNEREQQEYLRFNREEEDPEEEDDGISGREGVMDLGVTTVDDSDSDDSDSDDSSSDDDDDESKEHSEELELSDDDDDSSVEMNDDSENVLDWGRSKASYYHGDTADLEIGQDEEDAMVEEEAAKEILKTRYADMDEEDFLFSDIKEEEKKEEKVEKEDTTTSTVKSKTTSKAASRSRLQKKKQLQSHHPELLPLVNHFSQVVQEYNTETRVVANALFESEEDTSEAIGATPMGLRFLVTKSALQASVALNVATYLLLKSEENDVDDDGLLNDSLINDDNNTSSIRSHPIMERLQQYNSMMQKLQGRVEDKVGDSLSLQMSNLVKAAALMRDEEQDEEEEMVEENKEDESTSSLEKEDNVVQDTGTEVEKHAPAVSSSDENEEDVAQGVLNEARFGLRATEVGTVEKKHHRRKRVPMADIGDDCNDDATNTKASQALASTINAMEQKSQTRKRRAVPTQPEEGIDDVEESLSRGLAMMEEQGLFASDKEDEDGSIDNELIDDDDGDGFYNQVRKKSKAKKDERKSMYQVAPKYPSMQQEVEGERAISRAIFKNRGLVAHKSKLNRNPRVKKREQYRKALIRRKGAVREVRTNEAQKYGGEETGIKSGLSRSRKLGVK